MELLKAAAEMGAPCFLAVVIFIVYRIDRRDSQKTLHGLLEQDQQSRRENTKALTELRDSTRNNTEAIKDLSQAIRGMNGRH